MTSQTPPNTHSQDIAAIYDIVWQASTHPAAPLSIQTVHAGSHILFKKELVATNSPSVARKEYRACVEIRGIVRRKALPKLQYPLPPTVIVSSLKLISTTSPPADHIPLSTPSCCNHDQTSPGTLDLTSTSTVDSDGYRFLHFQYQASTEILDENGEKLQMCAVGWAKRREFDDEVPTGRDACLSATERERLVRRKEIDMVGLQKEEDGMGGVLEEGEIREYGRDRMKKEWQLEVRDRAYKSWRGTGT